jgi:predicted DNA binding CopG/RHH family protein
MRETYDFKNSFKNPYLKKLKKQISIRLDIQILEYFKELSIETGIPYQNLINMYLADCATKHLKPKVLWNK